MGRGTKARGHGGTKGGALLLALAMGACAPRVDGPRGPPPTPAPSYAALAEAQARRVEALGRLHAEGVVEVRWTDEGERRLVQGDVNLWIRLPRHTALRVSKLGDDLLWLGSDEVRYWLFDCLAEERVLLRAGHELELSDFTAAPISFRPLALLDLAGLTPLPPRKDGEVSWSPEHRAWAVTVAGAGGPARLLFDPATLLPLRVESLDESGRPRLSSELKDYARVTLPGVALHLGPLFPQVIRIGDADARAAVTLFLRDELSGDVSDELIDRITDLERLMTSLQPHRIIEQGGRS